MPLQFSRLGFFVPSSGKFNCTRIAIVSFPGIFTLSPFLQFSVTKWFDYLIGKKCFPINYTIRDAKWTANWTKERKNWTKLSASRKNENWDVNERKVKTLLVLLNQFVILREKQNSAKEGKHTEKRLQNRVFHSIGGDWWIRIVARN